MTQRSIRTSQHALRHDLSRGRYFAIAIAALFTSIALLAVGCAPEVGSEAWCTSMKEKPKADWSPNEAVDYAKHCLL